MFEKRLARVQRGGIQGAPICSLFGVSQRKRLTQASAAMPIPSAKTHSVARRAIMSRGNAKLLRGLGVLGCAKTSDRRLTHPAETERWQTSEIGQGLDN